MKRKVLVWSFALIFALTPLLVTAQGTNSNGMESTEAEASITDMMALIEQFYDEGEFNNHGAARSLLAHLTSVNHFYQNGQMDKAKQHMNGFVQFLDLQKEHQMISEQAHGILKPIAEDMVLDWNALTIVQNGQAHAAIYLSSAASDMEELAASELQDTLAMISGAELPIVANGESSLEVQITLVTPDSNPEISQQFTDDLDFLQDSDGFAIRRLDNTIYIIGANPRGVLNGVYEFLEENTGILWTRSKEEGTIYEPQSTIKAIKVDYREKSPFEIRGWHTTGRGDEGIAHVDFKTLKMFARNKMNAKYAMFSNQPYWAEHEAMGLQAIHLGHNLKQWLPNEEYFESHPEYYDMVNGEYVPVSGRTQLNFFHPDLPGVFAQKVIDFHSESGTEYIGIGIEDTNNFTQSPESRQPFTTPDGVVVQPDDPAFRSTVFFTFLNKVAAEVKGAYPDVKIVAFAYFFAEVPPKVDLEDNIVIMTAPVNRDLRLPLNTDDEQSQNYQSKLMLEDWVTKTKNIIYRGYYGCCAADSYERPIAEVVQADAQYFRDLGIMGFLPEGVVDANRTAWGVNALQFWLIGQLYWDPDADLEALKEEYMTKAYGDAAEAMKRYYDVMEQGWNADDQPIGIYANESMLITQYVILAGIKDEAQGALDEAWDLANDEQKARIEPIRTTYMELTDLYDNPNQLAAYAIKTSATKEEILQSLDFSTGPWTATEPISDFNIHRSDTAAPVDTNVYLLWDDEHLYVGYESFDDNISDMVISEVVNNYWADGTSDSAETHVSTGPGSTTYAYFNNPEANGFVYRTGPSPAPDLSIETNAVIQSDRWNIVQVIPFSQIGLDPMVSRELRALFVRNYHGSANYTWEGGAVWSPPEQGSILLMEEGELPPISANLDTERIHAATSGSYPFSITIRNRTAELIQIGLDGVVPEHISLDLDPLVSLEARQQVVVQGTVTLDSQLPEGEYNVTINTSVHGEGEAIHELQLPIHLMRNLVPNPGFEEELNHNNWYIQSQANVERSQENARSGDYALTISPSGSLTNSGINSYQAIPVTQGKTYRLSIWAKNESSNGGSYDIRMFDENNREVGFRYENLTPNSDWTPYSITFEPTENTDTVRVYLRSWARGSELPDGAVSYDDIRLEVLDD